MRKIFFTLLFSLLNFVGFSQIIFESGYFIDNHDEKTICLIRNVDWSDNPDKFEYKLPNSEVVQIATIKDVKQFEITGESKYERFTVQMDRSSSSLNNLESSRTPVFNEEVHFLKILVEGNATLYKFTDGQLKRYFIKTNMVRIEQLVYKPFLTNDNKVGFNNYYRQQLWNYLKCDGITMAIIDKLEYQEKSLVNFCSKFNSCSDPSLKTPHQLTPKRDLFNLSIRPGIDISSLSLQNPQLIKKRVVDFGQKTFFRLGLEAEFILPFNKNRWSIFIEPTFQYYQSKTRVIVGVESQDVEVNYKNIDLPLGFRYYVHLNNSSKLYVNAAFAFGFAHDSSIQSDIVNKEITRNYKVIAGGGYCLKNRYSIEFRFNSYFDFFADTSAWKADFSGYSFIAGYRF